MNTKTFKPMMLALAGAVALAGAGSVQAVETPVLYKGTTTLTLPGGGGAATCTLYLVGSIDMTSGSVVIKAANTEKDGTTCDQIVTTNFPWTGTLSNTSGAGTLTLSTPSAGPGLSTLCQGAVAGITYTAPAVSITPDNGAGVPTYNPVPPSFNIPVGTPMGMSGCTIEGDLEWVIPRN